NPGCFKSPWRSSGSSRARQSSSSRRRSSRTAYSRSKISRPSPCCGARPCSSTKRWISSTPAMIRSSRAARPDFCSGSASTPSAASSASSSSVNPLGTRRLRPHAGEEGNPLCHAFLPRVGGGNRRQTAALLLEFQPTLGQFARLLNRQVDALCADHGVDLSEAFLAHGLGEDRIGLSEWIDAVDQIDVQFAHIHDEPADTIDEGGIRALFAVAFASGRNLLGPLGQVERGDGVLPHRLLVLFVQFGVFVLDDLPHAELGQLLGHQLLVEQAALDRAPVLHEGGNHLVEVLLADARRLLALGFGQTLDLDLELAGFLVEANIAFVRI